jgi:hypothetical protein
MKLLCAVLIYLGMGAALALGIILAVKGSLWLLILSVLAFFIARPGYSAETTVCGLWFSFRRSRKVLFRTLAVQPGIR